MPHRKAELRRILENLETFVKITCEYDPSQPRDPHDFVGEKCNEAYLMLQEVHDELDDPPKSDG